MLSDIPTLTELVITALDDIVQKQGTGLTFSIQPQGRESIPNRYDFLVMNGWNMLFHGEFNFGKRNGFNIFIMPFDGTDDDTKLCTTVDLLCKGEMEGYLAVFEELVTIANKSV